MNANRTQVLLVEDEVAHVRLIQRAFESRWPEVDLTVAGTLKEARACLAQAPPDLMIADLLLPDGQSTELLPVSEEEFRFPVVLMTGHGNEQVAVETIKAGVLDYVIKSPTTMAEMPRIADRAFGQWEDRVRRKHAEERLRLLSSAVEQSTEGIAVTDLGGNLLFVNEAFAAMHGYAPDELFGKHLSVFHTPEQMPSVDEANRRLKETGDFSGEIWHARRDGTVFPVHMCNSLLRDENGRTMGLVGTIRDVTELKQAEEELIRHRDRLEELVQERTSELSKANVRLLQEISDREHAEAEARQAERKMRAIFDHTFQFIGLMTPDGTLIEANRASLSFAGIEASDVLGKPFWETPWWTHSAELQRQLRQAIDRAAAGEFVRFEATHYAADGRLDYVDFSLKPVHDDDGKVCLLIPEGREITQRKQVEEALQKEQHLLRELLNLHERERKLVAYEIHDGLAQQLTGAQMTFQVAGRLLQSDPQAARENLNEALRLLGDSLAETRRLISGLRPPILDESGIVDALEYLIHEAQQREAVEIEFACDVRFDRLAPPLETAVFRIAQETLTNACRHSGSQRVRLEFAELPGHVRIDVQDWGIGFDPEAVEDDRFGLRGIRERARLFGGRVVIDTAPGQGTRIAVELPLVHEAPPDAQPGLPPE